MSDPITVMHLITSLNVGGAETMLLKLVKRSDRSRFCHRVVSLVSGGPLEEALGAADVKVYSLGMPAGSPTFAGLIRFLKLLRQEQPQVLQTWLYHADLLGVISRLFYKFPLIWNIRSAYHTGLGSAVVRTCARLSAIPDAVVVNSETGQKVHIDIGYHPRRWAAIPNGFDTDVFHPDETARASVRKELGLSTDAILIGLIGRYDPLKGHSIFLEAAERLAGKNQAVYFVLAGEGVTVDNLQLASYIGVDSLRGRVFMLGRRSDIPRLTAALDIATCSSIAEAFPNIIGEAMACGVPCVSTDVGDVAQIVGDCGILIPIEDTQALVAGWAKLIDQGADGRRRLGEVARQRIIQRYSLDAIVGMYENLYEEMAQNREQH
jgi:glycosyltransferase involved in cell wall biosynthesis